MNAVTEYAKKVVAGKINAGNSVKLACRRHLRDLEKSKRKDYPYYFDEEEAEHCFQFAERYCVHSKGKWAGQPLTLELWQKFIAGSIFGWKKKSDGSRRFTYFYIQVARKNGKSTFMAFVGTYILVCDGEFGAEIYSAATTRDQAKIIFNEARNMAIKSKQLNKLLTSYTNNVSFDKMGSFFRPVSADAKTLDGLNVHCALIDEYHAHPNSSVYDVMDSAKGARVQPIIGVGTTAGFDSRCDCKEKYDIYKNVLKGSIEMDDTFIYIAELDEDDDWTDPNVWVKANPNMGVSVFEADMVSMCKAAINSQTAQINFKVKKLNMWISARRAWLNIAAWNKCGVCIPKEELIGRKCYIGCDLANRNDLASVTAEFPIDSKNYACISHSFIPEDKIDELASQHKFNYRGAIEAGYMTATPGSIIDYDWIKAKIDEWNGIYDVLEVEIDPWSASQLEVKLLEEGYTVVEVRQGYRTMSEPVKDFEGVVNEGRITHYDDPLLKWAAGNAVLETDPAGNVKTTKDKSAFKIDPLQSLLIAHTRCYTHNENYKGYEERMNDYLMEMERMLKN